MLGEKSGFADEEYFNSNGVCAGMNYDSV